MSGAAAAIFWGGLACGVLDITAAMVVYGFFGARPMRILQGIAASLAAAVYVGASRVWPILIDQTLVAGPLYGIAVYFVMNHVVVPLSAVPKRPFSFKMMLIGILIHIFCVGLPIAVAARWFS